MLERLLRLLFGQISENWRLLRSSLQVIVILGIINFIAFEAKIFTNICLNLFNIGDFIDYFCYTTYLWCYASNFWKHNYATSGTKYCGDNQYFHRFDGIFWGNLCDEPPSFRDVDCRFLNRCFWWNYWGYCL